MQQNSYIVLAQERLAAISMLQYLPSYSQLSSHDKVSEVPKNGNWGYEQPLNTSGVAKRRCSFFKKYLDGLNPIETQICKSYIDVFPIVVDAFTSDGIYGLLAL